MVNRWMAKYPADHVHVTCMTLTGSKEIQKRLGDKVSHSYLPYDLPCAMSRFYQRIPAAMTIIMETELWPNLLNQAKRHNTRTLVMNARLSERSFYRYNKWQTATEQLLLPLDKICCQNQATLERFQALGAAESKLDLTGNLKFDMDISAQILERGDQLRQQLGNDRPVWIAGSTHEGEDEVLLQAHQQILQQYADALLILVPRHPERFEQVAKLIANQGLSFERRSSADVSANAQVLLGDTMGELLLMYRTADFAFVGGSLIPRGGHNPLEAVALACPVLSGKQVFNFTEVYQMLDDADGMLWATSAREISTAIEQLISDSNYAGKMAQAANEVLQRHQGACLRTIEAIEAMLPE
ncbi:3-deoxy-D-manno-octulosonic acid transferase [Neiella marina]|uniref:3-deoxy-D-manno-octulosonic acid transferase n=1 Tax=Neiella marina TaxID=508461 RepID=A0A8J2U492_9GAMM|nr:3-deoxy-D-manno-octulosonic acid transferase [Neiella marina]